MKDQLGNIGLFILCSICLLLPIFPKLIPGLIVLYGLVFILEKPWSHFRRLKQYPFVYISISIFILTCLGLISSYKLSDGFAEVQTKMSFLLLPIIIFLSPKKNSGALKYYFISFIIGCIISGLISNINAAYLYVTYKPWIAHFFGKRFSIMIHLGYFAIYLNCAILFAYWLYWKYRSKFSSLTFILIQIILHALLFQTTSKNGLIVWFLNSAVIAFLYIYHRKKIMPVIVGFLVISAGLVITWQTVPYFQDRIYDLRNAFETKDKDSGTSIRRVAWEESAEIIKENVLVGVGTANVKPELHKRFVAKKLDRAAEINLDPHNQYLQSFAEHGILGLLALISLLVYPIYIGIKDKSVLLTLFGFTFLIAASTESIFQTQGGIIYYLLFLSLLLVNRRYLSSSSLFYSRLN